jgi:predicted transcriptional regulator
MSNTEFSIRLPDDQKDFLDSLAAATQTTRNEVISTVVGKMKENYDFVMAKIAAGEADIKAGRTVTMAEAKQRTQAVIDRSKAKTP